MKKTFLLIAIAGCVALAACQRGEEPTPSPSGLVDLYLAPSAGVKATTYAAVTGSGDPAYPFPTGSVIGVVVAPSGTVFTGLSTDYNLPGYYNIKGTGSRPGTSSAPAGYSSQWNYLPAGGTGSGTIDKIGLAASQGNVDIYGYHPWHADITKDNFAAYPFTLGVTDSTNFDYMYTGVSPVTVLGNMATPTTPPLNFRHLFTMLDFQLSTTYVGTLRIRRIVLSATHGANGSPVDVFVREGTINWVDGTVTPSVAPATISDTLSMAYNKTLPRGSAGQCALLFPAISNGGANNDVVITVRFEFEDPQLPAGTRPIIGQTNPLTIDLASASYVATNGLAANTRYIFGVRVDNYIKYSSFPEITTNWTDIYLPDIEF